MISEIVYYRQLFSDLPTNPLVSFRDRDMAVLGSPTFQTGDLRGRDHQQTANAPSEWLLNDGCRHWVGGGGCLFGHG